MKIRLLAANIQRKIMGNKNQQGRMEGEKERKEEVRSQG